MSDYQIAIPSYKRYDMIKRKTISYLSQTNANTNVHIFVANNEEYKIYKSFLGSTFNIIEGVPTLTGQRFFIQNYFDEDELIIQMDDDVDALMKLNSKGKLEVAHDFEEFVETGRNLMQKHNTKLFGVYPVCNHFFMKNEPTTNLCLLVGSCWGCINEHDVNLKLELNGEKEDYERTIKYYEKFKAVVRLNNYTSKSNYFENPGGLMLSRTKETELNSAKYLVNKYPQYAKMTKDKNGYAQIDLGEYEFQKETIIDNPFIIK